MPTRRIVPASHGDCPVIKPDYSQTRSVGRREYLVRLGTDAERNALDPGALWGLRCMEGDFATAFYAYDPSEHPEKSVVIKNSTDSSVASGEILA